MTQRTTTRQLVPLLGYIAKRAVRLGVMQEGDRLALDHMQYAPEGYALRIIRAGESSRGTAPFTDAGGHIGRTARDAQRTLTAILATLQAVEEVTR